MRTKNLANYLIAIVLVLVPFHAFLTIFAAHLFGGYTLWRLWDDIALALLLLYAAVILLRKGQSRAQLRRWFFSSLLVRLILMYAGLTLLLGVVALLRDEVGVKAVAYGILINLRFLAWFLALVVIVKKSNPLAGQWTKLLLVPAAIVVVFAALQYTVLPHNFLSHFGYNAATNIAPIETINHNTHYIRVQSFLRGANPLGAYLVIVVSALLTLQFRRRWMAIVLGVLTLFALYASGSRSAWIGAAITGGVVAWTLAKTKHQKIRVAVIGAAVVVVLGAFLLVFHHNEALQNALFHTQNGSTSESSNDAHASGQRQAIDDVLHQPLGDGPGTAGPASVYNTGHNARIDDDYYLQIAQETGWLGLALLLTIFVLVAMELRMQKSPLALTLFASFVGLGFVALLSHSWSDDTLAFTWWGLAAVALGNVPNRGVKQS